MKYFKTIIFTIFIATSAFIAMPAFAQDVPPTQDNGTTADDSSAPSTQDNGTTAGSNDTPSTQDNGTTADTGNNPATQDNGTTAGSVSLPATQDNGTTAGGASNTVTTPPPAGGTNTNTSGGGTTIVSGGGGIFGGNTTSGTAGINSPFVAAPVIAVANILPCKYINSYMKIGQSNSSAEVIKLQSFLKDIEKSPVDVNGIFDQKTANAVKVFQKKYSADILFPWGLNNPTGHVYFTTAKKINEIYCKTNLPLTSAQIAQIQKTKSPTATVEKVIVKVAATSTLDKSQTASVKGTSVANKVWNFFKLIFWIKN